MAAPTFTAPAEPVVKVMVPTVTQVTGKAPAYLLTHFGEPDLKRRETGAAFWTYTHRRCSVFFILYQEADSDYTVHLVEVERHMADSRPLQAQIDACLSDIAYAHQAPEADSGAGS